jgi:biotin synthase
VENLGELQPLAVKAGLNGVMMGNFLTTLGSAPEEDRQMFEELGLNVARQPDNGSRPRPDNRSGWLDGDTPGWLDGDTPGWLDGDTPDVIAGHLDSASPQPAAPLEVRLWDPSTQLRFRAKHSVPPRPDGAPNASPVVAGTAGD